MLANKNPLYLKVLIGLLVFLAGLLLVANSHAQDGADIGSVPAPHSPNDPAASQLVEILVRNKVTVTSKDALHTRVIGIVSKTLTIAGIVIPEGALVIMKVERAGEYAAPTGGMMTSLALQLVGVEFDGKGYVLDCGWTGRNEPGVGVPISFFAGTINRFRVRSQQLIAYTPWQNPASMAPPQANAAQTRSASMAAFKAGVPEEQIALARAAGANDKDIDALRNGYSFEQLTRDLQSRKNVGINAGSESVLFIIRKGTHFHGHSGYGYNVTLFTGKLFENKQGRETSLLCDGLLTPNKNLLTLRFEKPRHYKMQTHEFGKEKTKETTCKE